MPSALSDSVRPDLCRSFRRLTRWASLAPTQRLLLKAVKELLVGPVCSDPTPPDILRGLTLALLPGRCPKPRLGAVDSLPWPEQDALSGHRYLHLVALLEVSGLADLRGD